MGVWDLEYARQFTEPTSHAAGLNAQGCNSFLPVDPMILNNGQELESK